MLQELRAMSWPERLRYRWPTLLAIAFVPLLLLFVLLRIVIALPGDGRINLPAQLFFWDVGTRVFWPFYLCLVGGIVLMLPYLISSRIQRVDYAGKMSMQTKDVRGLFTLIIVAALGYALLQPTIGHPVELDRLDTASARYYLLYDERDLYSDVYFVYRCEDAGSACELLIEEQTTRGGQWQPTARLRATENGVQVHNGGFEVITIAED